MILHNRALFGKKMSYRRIILAKKRNTIRGAKCVGEAIPLKSVQVMIKIEEGVTL